jgi:hypothetical protein
MCQPLVLCPPKREWAKGSRTGAEVHSQPLVQPEICECLGGIRVAGLKNIVLLPIAYYIIQIAIVVFLWHLYSCDVLLQQHSR